MAQTPADDRSPAPLDDALATPSASTAGVGGRRLRDPGSGASLRLAWAGTILLLGLTLALQLGLIGGRSPAGPEQADLPAPPSPLFTLQARYAVGVSRLLAEGASADSAPATFARQLEAAASSRPGDQLRLAMTAGQIVGADAALARLDALGAALAEADEPTPDWLARDLATLRAIYSDSDAVAIDDDAREGLIDRHGWFGELALAFGADTSDARRRKVLAQAARASLAAGGIAVLALAGVIVGAGLLFFAGIKWSQGALQGAYKPPASGGSAHLETFALFLLAFLALSALGAWVEALTGARVAALLMWLILPVALWPMLRGSPASAWRFAIGWHGGRGVVREMGAGIVGYIAGLPILALGLALTIGLMALWSLIAGPSEGGGGPVHPVAGEAMGAGVWTITSIYLLGVVWAPIVEETFFRGSLYHHLRGRLTAWGAALLVGLIFAMMHPQGPLAIPAIAALGFNFAMIRQWRGSLIAPATAHALSNFVVLSMLFLALA